MTGARLSWPSVYQASSNMRVWSATWNTGVTPWSTNARQIRSWAGSDSARPSTGAGAIIASPTPAAARSEIWSSAQVPSRRVRCPTGSSRSPPAGPTSEHQRFHAPMLAVRAGSEPERGRSQSSP